MFKQNTALTPLFVIKGACIALLVVWMAWSLSSLLWRLLPQPELNKIDVVSGADAFNQSKSASQPGVDVQALKSIPLFGKSIAAAPVAKVEKVKEEDLAATKLSLKLVGSFASENQQKAYAIIANGKKQELYKVNQEITGMSNVKLVSVASDKVIINNRGRQEALHMYPEGEPISSTSVASSALRAESRSVPNDRSSSLAVLNPNQRLEKISDAIRFSRKTQNGQMLGFRVLPGRNRAAFEQTGLKLNDVVTAIDGQVLDNLRTANQIYQKKRNETQASLTVLRGEEEIAIDVDLNNINVN